MMKFTELVRRERLYILLLIFVMLAGLLFAVSGQGGKVKAESAKAKVAANSLQMEKLLQEERPLAIIFTIASLLIIFILFLGVVVDIILFSARLSGKAIDIHTYRPDVAKWDILDIARVIILFLFFGYILIIIESFLVKTLPVIKNGNLRMVLNSSILDALTIILILYFTVWQYKEKLKNIGITFKNFFANILYGVVGYVATLPLLFLILALTSVVTGLFKYVPKEQVVVELFMRENNPAFLLYTSAFAAIAGPIVEELFFRGFMYSAVKKHAGIFWATVITALLFALLHAHAVGFLPIMVLGILLAYLYERTGTLVSSVTVHIMHNFSMLLLVFLAKSVKGM